MEPLVTFDLSEPGTGSSPRGAAGNADSGRRQGTKRKKYAARAWIQVTIASAGRSSVAEKTSASSVRVGTFDAATRLPPDHFQESKMGSPDGKIDPPLGCVTFTSQLISYRYSTPSRANSSHPAVPQARGTESSSSAGVPTAFSDPRVDGLCDRIRALERMLTHLLKLTLVSEDSSPGATFQTHFTPGLPEEDDNANQFAVRATAHDDLSLSSQVAAMSALLSRPPSPKPGSGKQNTRLEVLVEFPDPPSLQHLLDVYFRDMDNYFPFLDRQDTESRIYSVIRRLGYSSYNRMLVVTTEDLPVIALACIMLALAECVDSGEGACDGDTKPGWERYLQSYRAIHCFSQCKTLDLNIVRAQCLVAAYLMHCESLNAASEAVSVTWRLATSIRLNNKRAWPNEDAKRTLQRQQLWWTIYYLDRQISRRSGAAYHIRDTEFDVDDFTLNGNAADGNPLPQTDWHSSITRSYLQALIALARLWGQVWDTFFAVGATKKGDWMEVEIMDARILNTRRQLPKALTWDSDELANYMLAGEDDPHIRRRLLLFTRLELLRMLIRQNPVRRAEFNPETAHLCARLSRGIIRAHDLYISRYPEARSIGYIATSSTVECIYHLAPVMHYSKDDNEHSACVSAFHQAHGILVKLSAYNNVAKRALKALNGVVKKWGSGNTTGNTGSLHPVVRQSEVGDCSIMDAPPQVHEFQGTNVQTSADSFEMNLGEWMSVSMGSLYGNEFDFRPDTQL